MKNSSRNVKIVQWNSRSFSTSLLAVEHHMSQGNYCILALQSLTVEKKNLPRMNNYYYPPLCNSNKKTKNVQTAVYIRSDLVYTIPISSPVTNALEDVYAITTVVKMNEQGMLSPCPFEMDQKVNGCTLVTCNRLVDNIVDSSLCLLNDGRITRIPDVSTHKATAIDRPFSCCS